MHTENYVSNIFFLNLKIFLLSRKKLELHLL